TTYPAQTLRSIPSASAWVFTRASTGVSGSPVTALWAVGKIFGATGRSGRGYGGAGAAWRDQMIGGLPDRRPLPYPTTPPPMPPMRTRLTAIQKPASDGPTVTVQANTMKMDSATPSTAPI